MNKNFSIPHIPIVFVLLALISKEVFSYDGERVVILCILTFILTAYFQLREGMSQMFILRTQKLEEEFITLFNLKIKLRKAIANLLTMYENMLETAKAGSLVIKTNLKNYINKNNRNRGIYSSKLLKDQVNTISKNNLFIIYKLNDIVVNKFVNNFISMLYNKVISLNIYLSNNFFFKKTNHSVEDYNFKNLLENKLNIEFVELNFNVGNWYTLNTVV